MFTDRDFYRSVLAGALENFGLSTLAVILNVPALEVTRWARGRTRPPAPLLLQVIDLMWPRNRVLVAVSLPAEAPLARIPAAHPVDMVGGFGDGVAALRRGHYSDVIIGYGFAESRMLEFAREARQLQPGARVLCVKAGGLALGSDVCVGLNEAAIQIGCEGFIDLGAGAFNHAFEDLVAHA